MTRADDAVEDAADGRSSAASPLDTRHAARTLGWSSVGTIAMFVSGAIAIVVLARMLPPEVFGAMTAASTIGLILRAVGPVSITQAMISQDASAHALRTGTTLAWITATAMAATLVALASPLAAVFEVSDQSWIFRAWALVILAQGIAAAPLAQLQHDLSFKQLSAVQVVASVTGTCVVPITLAALGWGLPALFAGVLTSALVEAVGTTAFCRRLHLPGRGGGVGAMARATAVFSSTAATVTLAGNGDNLVIGARLGDTALGLYSRAYRLMSLPAILVGDAVDTALFPMIRRTRDDVDRIVTGVRAANTVLAVVLLPISAISIVTAPILVPALLGDRWSDSVPIFRVLAVGMFFRVGAKPFAAVLRGSGYQHRLAKITAVNAAAVVIGALLGQRWGTTGVATAVVLTLAGYYAVMVTSSMRSVGRPVAPVVQSVLAAVPLAALAAGASWWAMESTSGQADPLRLAAAIGAGLLVLPLAAVIPQVRDLATVLRPLSRRPAT